jgi:hypothetical protein
MESFLREHPNITTSSQQLQLEQDYDWTGRIIQWRCTFASTRR